MIRKLVGVVVLGLVFVLSACKATETEPDTTPVTGSDKVPSQEIETQIDPSTTSYDDPIVDHNNAAVEEAESLGLQMGSFYDINGNTYWGTMKFSSEGRFYYDDQVTGVYQEGEWTIVDGVIVVSL
ncbi:MAG: hypothetical protein LBM60_04905, partial [Clostridium sp.]|nr:hypothetical protein [Clostridium sp.]